MSQEKQPPPVERLSAGMLLRQTWAFVNEHEVLTRASAMAFSAITASVPLLAMVLLVLVQLLPDITAGPVQATGLGALMLEQMQNALQSMFPPEAYNVVAEQIRRMQDQPPVGLMSIGLIVTLWTSSGVFRAVIDALNRIYGLEETRPRWRVWLLSVWMTIVQTTILIGALLLIIVWPHVSGWFGLDPGFWVWNQGIRWLIVFTTVMLSFALCFHMGPDVPSAHRWVTPGSIVGTVLFLAACYGLKLYVQNFAHYDKTYGSLGGVMTLLLWFYVSSLVFLLSAEINRIVDFAAKQYKQCRARRE